jgi:hypothetical protein
MAMMPTALGIRRGCSLVCLSGVLGMGRLTTIMKIIQV